MAFENTIAILIAAKDEASKVLDGVAINAKAASAETNGSLGSIGGAAGKASTGFAGVATAAGVAAAVVVGSSTLMAVQFQQKMEMLHTDAGVAQNALAGISTAIMNLAPQVGQGPEALATAFYHVASAGTGIWSTAQQLDILKVAAEGAAIGQASLDDTTYALTSSMASGVTGAKNAAEMMGTLTAIVGAGDMKLEDLNGAIGTGFLSTAATFGISIQSVGTALATLTDNGEHADAAATRLRMTWALMGSPSGAATKQLEALGLTAEDAKKSTDGMNAVFAKSGLATTKLADDLRQPNGITVAMRDLQTHLEKAGLSASETDAMLSKAFGGGRTDAALLTMLNNLDRMDEKFKVINSTASNFSSNFAAQQQTAAQQVKDAWAAIQVILTHVGLVALPIVSTGLRDFTQVITGHNQVVNDWSKAISNGVGPTLSNLWRVITTQVSPALSDLWLKVIVPFLPVLGTAFVLALNGVVTAATGLFQIVTPVVNFLVANKDFLTPIIGTFVALKGAMMLQEAFSALQTGFLILQSNSIPALMLQLSGLDALIASPIVMPAIAIGAALLAIQQVWNAYNNMQGAISGAETALHNLTNESISLDAHFIGIVNDGISDAHTKQLARQFLHNTGVKGYALGTNFASSDSYIAGENGPELITGARGSKVHTANETKQMLGGGTTVSIGTWNNNSNMDEQKFLKQLGWKLSLA